LGKVPRFVGRFDGCDGFFSCFELSLPKAVPTAGAIHRQEVAGKPVVRRLFFILIIVPPARTAFGWLAEVSDVRC
tara:strand:- start:431 stop:655 length:225 start_codon:yes stop_codon:yes gene_type:complete